MLNFDVPSYYINRELSWLSFNERVLEESLDTSNPLFERMRFISIACSNLDEFFMIRVAGLKDQVKSGFHKPDNKTQLSASEQLKAICDKTHAFVREVYHTYNQKILPQLNVEKIHFLSSEQLSPKQTEFVEEYFHHHVYPVLTPLAVDASRPFPMILNKSLNLAVLVQRPNEKKHNQVFALVQVPSVLPRFIQLPSPETEKQFILLEEIIVLHIETLFEGSEILAVSPFRITRNLDLIIDMEGEEDVLEAIEKELKKRKKGSAVRIEVGHKMCGAIKDTLQDWLELEDDDIYRIHGPIDLTFLSQFINQKGFEQYKYEDMPPQLSVDFSNGKDIFEAIAQQDILLHHPYQSFEHVVYFIRQAAEDPDVLAIKQTLYRVGGNSPIVQALARAAENGKQVTVLVELKARFDEENNIVWAKKLEEAGCHVIYGVDNLKTHSKITLVVRREQNVIRRYVHLSTGNYNSATARIYTDLGLFTSKEEFGIDASAFFNHLSGVSDIPKWEKITIAPIGMRKTFLDLIENEIDQSTDEHPGHIIAKMNSLTDKEIIKALYRASCAGVRVDLIVRGICCLRPGIPGVSENITVRSIVGRFLEHSRIYFFQNGGENRYLLSSADWMTRNMTNRVEILFPVQQENLQERLKEILRTHLLDNTKARVLVSDGTYIRHTNQEAIQVDSQMYFYQAALHDAKRHSFTIH